MSDQYGFRFGHLIAPLGAGREAIADQARRTGIEVPVGLTVGQLRQRGFDTDPAWPDDAVYLESPESPTGYVVSWAQPFSDQTAVWALAT